jgi:predicted amidohydrolase YtcJ
MDLSGHYIMPGIFDMHAHIAGKGQGVPARCGRMCAGWSPSRKAAGTDP